MTDAAQSQLSLTTDAVVPVVEVTTPAAHECGASPAPAEKAAKGKGLRALRDRIALRRSYSTKHSSHSSPTIVSPVAEFSRNVQEKKKHTKPNAFGRFINTKLVAKTGMRKEGVASTDAAISLDTASFNSSRPDGEVCLPTLADTVAVATGVEPVVIMATTDPDPEPLTLARKIQSLLSSLPPFLSDGQTNKDGDDTAAPNAPNTISDSRAISLLMSPSFMNGSLARGGQSVWAMLDNIRLKSSANTGSRAEEGTTPVDNLVEDGNSVMFYAPLLPDENSSVELARSEIVSVDENGIIVEVLMDNAPLPRWNPSTSPSVAGVEAFKWHWPWQRDPSAPPKPKTIEKRMWVPSTTKLSLQVMWWGYKLWLPPPVLAKLNDKEIEAAKLGAVVTTALSWLLNNVPESALPPTLRPALLLVKSLVPYLGYIGGFVAWSWSAIKGFDIGNGITLTATWLLPIALIPGTWSNEAMPTSPPSSDPSAPPANNPSSPPASSAPSGNDTAPAPVPGNNPSSPPASSAPSGNDTAPAPVPGNNPSPPANKNNTSVTEPTPLAGPALL